MNFPYRKRTRELFVPDSPEPFRMSRTKIDLFLECPRCFYLDRKLGIGRPNTPPFTLNVAVDELLKKEFDTHRANGDPHPLMTHYGIDAVPFQDERMDEWRDSLRRGIRHVHAPTNFVVTGGVDDVWVNPERELIVVDYKATAKNSEVNIDADWQISYKRQIEVYQWLFRQNGFAVSPTGYFVYCNGKLDSAAFDGKLEFDVKVIPYKGDDSWVDGTLREAHACLLGDLPQPERDCQYCTYRKEAALAAHENKKRIALS